MNNNHRFVIQFMLKRGSVTLEEALSFYKHINPANANLTELKTLFNEINREISKQSFKIVVTRCEVTNQDVVLWLNTKSDFISKLQSNFSPIELEYFNAIIVEIIEANERKILFPRCINISSTLTAHYARESGQNVLYKWIEGSYLVKQQEFVYLGPRTIQEFATYLRSHCQNCDCGLCLELVFTGKICASCGKIFHSFCLNKYFQKHKSCPNCKNEWNETTVFQGTQNEDSEEDESQVGPNKKLKK